MGKRLNGTKITEYMKKHGVDYGALAAEIEVSPSLLRQMEDGYYPRRGGDEIVGRLAQRMGVSVAALTLTEEAKQARTAS
jgi:hypothetical protein